MYLIPNPDVDIRIRDRPDSGLDRPPKDYAGMPCNNSTRDGHYLRFSRVSELLSALEHLSRQVF